MAPAKQRNAAYSLTPLPTRFLFLKACVSIDDAAPFWSFRAKGFPAVFSFCSADQQTRSLKEPLGSNLINKEVFEN